MGKDFTPSDGWLSRWKKRRGIFYRREHGEVRSADQEGAQLWIEETLRQILSVFDPEDVYNADETGLYFRGLPDQGHTVSSKKLSGMKIAKDRITVLACCNMSGTDKRPLLVIGKSKQPRCFPTNLKTLPVVYKNSAKSWMTSCIFTDWLKDFNKEIRSSGRHICLLVDNCSAHPKIELSNIIYEFLPPNTTSLIQPLDQVIIRNLKGFYRSKLCCRIITELDLNEDISAGELIKTITLLDAVHLIAESWDNVKESTIDHCFKHAGFRNENDEMEETEEFDSLADIPLPDNVSRDDFLAVQERDDEIVICRESSSTVFKALGVVRKYCQKTGLERPVFQALRAIEKGLEQEIRQSRTQTLLTDFFPSELTEK